VAAATRATDVAVAVIRTDRPASIVKVDISPDELGDKVVGVIILSAT
jgi:hypothetical protein